MPQSAVRNVLDDVTGARVIQLGQLIDTFATKWSAVPDFEQRLYGRHDPSAAQPAGQYPGVTGASDSVFMSTHSGTHMDSLSHVAVDGVLHDGTHIDAPGVQDDRTGVRLRTRENFSPIVSRGVLIDLAAFLGVTIVPRDHVMDVAEFEECCRALGVDVRAGDSVLFRMGYDTIAHDNDEYTRLPLPGPDGAVARRLVELGVVSTGSDTMPFEAAPGPVNMAGHVELLVKGGVFIYEMLDLRELASSGARKFLFVAAPLRLRGGTGSPINPLAVLV